VSTPNERPAGRGSGVARDVPRPEGWEFPGESQRPKDLVGIQQVPERRDKLQQVVAS
jgi:hypothetical protein